MFGSDNLTAACSLACARRAQAKAFPEHYWKPLLKKAELRYRQPYQLRPTYASTMLSSGENIHWLARQMGHRDATMILRTYGKWIPDVDPSAGSKAEELAKTLTK